MFTNPFSVPAPLVLDVSLRDGGYLNHWQFEASIIEKAVSLAAQAGADVIEVGYLDNQAGLTVAASCPPAFLAHMRDYCGQARLAGMIRPNVKDPEHVLRQRLGLLDLLRIPVDMRAPEAGFALAELCKEFGFAVSINLVGASCFDYPIFGHIAAKIPTCIDVLYIADSRGGLTPQDIRHIYAELKTNWQGSLGYHAHNNLGLAQANTQAAIAAGCTWIDASLDGVGLGGRNLTLKEAILLAREQGRDFDSLDQALNTRAQDLDLPAVDEELALYRLTGERHLRMEWVPVLLERFGFDKTAELLKSLPQRDWFEVQELKDYLRSEDWQCLPW